MMNLRMLVAAGICSHFGTMADDAIYPVANTKGYESPSGWTLSHLPRTFVGERFINEFRGGYCKTVSLHALRWFPFLPSKQVVAGSIAGPPTRQQLKLLATRIRQQRWRQQPEHRKLLREQQRSREVGSY